MPTAEKDDYEKTEEEVERLLGPSPTDKPPREDRQRRRVEDEDPDIDGDPDVSDDPDLSMNYKDIGGSARRVALYYGTHEVAGDGSDHMPPRPHENIHDGPDLDVEDFKTIVSEAVSWWETDWVENLLEDADRELALRIALDYGIYTADDGRYHHSVDAPNYQLMIRVLDRVMPK